MRVTYLEVVEDGSAVFRGDGVVDGHDDAFVAAVPEHRRSSIHHETTTPTEPQGDDAPQN